MTVEVATDRFGVTGTQDPFEVRVKVKRGHIRLVYSADYIRTVKNKIELLDIRIS